MEFIQGIPAFANYYYELDNIHNKIQRMIESGNNILLVGPNRIGKSSILYHFFYEENPNYIDEVESTEEENEHLMPIFCYLNAASIYSSEELLFKIIQTITQDRIYDIIKKFRKTKFAIESIGLLNLFNVGIKSETKEYYKFGFKEICFENLGNLQTGNFTFYILIDDFSLCLNNCLRINWYIAPHRLPCSNTNL